MPKSNKIPSTHRQSPSPIAQARQTGSLEPQPGHRNTINWSSADDEVLVAARTAGLNWQTTAAKHFPHKTANACRKRHERLIERRTHEDWTTKRLDSLAVEYMELRKEIWGPLATKIGERWSVVEAKAGRKCKPPDKCFANESASAWRRVSEIYSHLHVPLAKHLLSVRTSLPLTRMSTKAIPALAVQRLNWSQLISLPLYASLPQAVTRCTFLYLGSRPISKVHCITFCPGLRHCLCIIPLHECLLVPSQAQAGWSPLDCLTAVLQSESEHPRDRLSGVSVSSQCLWIRHRVEQRYDRSCEYSRFMNDE
jgi:hypothetical protein